jgi:hypothetical protein
MVVDDAARRAHQKRSIERDAGVLPRARVKVDDAIAAQMRSLANDPKFKLASAYLTKFINREGDMEIKRRSPREATAHLLGSIARK